MGSRNYKGSVTKYLDYLSAVMYMILHQTVYLKPQLLQSKYGTSLFINHNSCIGTIGSEYKLRSQRVALVPSQKSICERISGKWKNIGQIFVV